MYCETVKTETIGLTLEAAAKLAGVSAPTMLSWVNRSDFPAFRSGRRWVIPRDSLLEWMKAQAAERATI